MSIIGGVDNRIKLLRDLDREELGLVNSPSVWDRISKLCEARVIERSYVSNGYFGSGSKIIQYMVTDTEVSFFDATGFVVFARSTFDLSNAELDEYFESNSNQSVKSAGRHD